MGKIFIPNIADDNNELYIHKTKKYNYLCTMNPTQFTDIELTITDLLGQTAFNDFGKFILELVFIPRSN